MAARTGRVRRFSDHGCHTRPACSARSAKVDVFSDVVFAGNPVAVVVAAGDGLDDVIAAAVYAILVQ